MFRIPSPARLGWVPVALGALLVVLGDPASAQQKPKELQWTHAFDLACRRYGEDKFTDKTQKYGVEVFKDNNNGLGLYVSQTGSMAVAHGFTNLKAPAGKSEGPKWLTGLDLPARKAGEKAFTRETRSHSLEEFLDPNADNWLFISEKGNIAATGARTKSTTGTARPEWIHSVDLSVRKGGVRDWKGAAKYGIEVYRDPNTNNFVYVTENGQFAIAPATAVAKGDTKAPEWLHGLDLACRKHDEKAFTKETRKFGVEVFYDSATGHYLLICETGSIAVAPAPKEVKAPTSNVKEPRWTHGLNVKARKFGEKDFSDKTEVFGAEVFRDDNIGATIYIGETGVIAAALTK
jgi:hypothetical protein